MSNVNNDFPQLPIYPDERFHHSDQEVRGTQQYLSHLFSGLPVKVAPDLEPRCISSESDADSNAESIVKKVLDVVFDDTTVRLNILKLQKALSNQCRGYAFPWCIAQ